MTKKKNTMVLGSIDSKRRKGGLINKVCKMTRH